MATRFKTGRKLSSRYWDRIRKLKFDFVRKIYRRSDGDVSAITLSVQGVSVAIVGTTKPRRWQENARFVAEGNLSNEEYEAIRARWREVADESWVGMT